MAVQTGLSRLAEQGLPGLKGRRVGLICNPTSVDAELRHAVELLQPTLNLTALFGPEHGVRGDAQDMIGIDDARDPVSGLPVHSLYGHTEASLTPDAGDARRHVDVVIFDVQDAGSRYYTFVWTMVLAMRACAKAGKQWSFSTGQIRSAARSRTSAIEPGSSRSSGWCRARIATA